MWKQPSLRSRILLVLSALVFITIGGGLASIWHTWTMQRLFGAVVELEVPALLAAQELKLALVMQKGYLARYYQDGNEQWLAELNSNVTAFEKWLTEARRWSTDQTDLNIVNEVESLYVRYGFVRDHVIALYKEGKQEEGFESQKKARGFFSDIMELCDKFKAAHEKSMTEEARGKLQQAATVNRLALAALTLAVTLGAILAYTLIKQVLGPIRQLAMQTDFSTTGGTMEDEIKALGTRFEKLMKDVDQTKSKLEWSREHLVQAEKWALVGKLAAGVAHSIRNPLTSVKMRLFSLQRSLALAPSQKEDFEVISEEVRHIDTIVSNFLEFSRPPKLKMQLMSPSAVIDNAVQLLRHRLDSYEVTVEVRREGILPAILADPDQLKEVLVNLMINAYEAMPHGGSIVIQEQSRIEDNLGPVITIEVTDDGPGVPKSLQGKVFNPFFSTKEEGTGLGLSIATRIVEEHGGWLDLKSEEGKGSTFIITLPAREDQTWG